MSCALKPVALIHCVLIRSYNRVAVATKQATNPVTYMAERLRLESVVSPVMNLPVKLVFGHAMLGKLQL